MSLSSCILALAAVSAFGCVSPEVSRDLDPLSVAPENYGVLFENDRVRVLSFRLRAGEAEGAHHHPPYLAYALGGFELRFSLPDGRTLERVVAPGDVIWSPEVTHAAVNTGQTDACAILIELK